MMTGFDFAMVISMFCLIAGTLITLCVQGWLYQQEQKKLAQERLVWIAECERQGNVVKSELLYRYRSKNKTYGKYHEVCVSPSLK